MKRSNFTISLGFGNLSVCFQVLSYWHILGDHKKKCIDEL